MEPIKCEKCGREMEDYEDESSIGMICPNCGWGWVRSYGGPLFEDQTVYVVKIALNDSPSRNDLATISGLFGINYLETSKMLKTGSGAFSGRADDIIKKLKKLKDGGIPFSVTPDFPHEIK